jgi:hypothetical protein
MATTVLQPIAAISALIAVRDNLRFDVLRADIFARREEHSAFIA